MTENRRSLLFFCVCLLAGILLRAGYLADLRSAGVMQYVVGADVSEYFQEARKILSGEWSVDPHSIHGALYPYILALFLALTGGSLYAARLLQGCFFLCGTLAGLYFLLRKMTSEEKGPLRFLPECVCLLVALYPPLVIYQCDFFSENAMIMLLIFSLLALAGKSLPSSGGSGILYGLALSSHAGGIFYGVFALLYAFLRERRDHGRKRAFFYCGAFVLGTLLILTPLCVYKSVKCSRFVLLQKNSMFNAFLGNNPAATGTCYLPPGVRWEAEFEKADQICRQQKITQDKYYRDQILRFILEDPAGFLRGLFKKGCMALSAREFTTWSDITSLRKSFFHAWGYHGWFLVLLLLGGPFLCLGCFREERRKLLTPFLMLFAAGFASQVFFITSGRYRLLLMIPLAVAGGAFLCSWYQDLKSIWSGMPVFVLSFLLFGISVYPYRISMQPERDYAKSLLADSFLCAGKPQQVLSLYAEEGAGASFPERRLSLKGRAYMALKRFDEAEKCFAECAEAFPMQAEHWMNLSALYSTTGRYGQALQALEQAKKRKLTPFLLADLEYNQGEIYQKCRRLDLAEKQYEKALALNRSHRKALNNAGTVFLMKRPAEPEKAISCFLRAVSLDQKNLSLQVNLALAYAMKGDKHSALQYLEKILSADPGHQRALRLQKMLLK